MSEASELREDTAETSLRLSAAIATIEHVLLARKLVTMQELKDLNARYVTGLDQELEKRWQESEQPQP